MLVIPLILTSIINAILTLGANDEQYIRKISYQTCALLLGMTAISSLIGLLVGKWFMVGQGLSLPAANLVPKHIYTGLTDSLLGMLPGNPVAAMAQENTIAVVLFAALFGVAARLAAQKEPEKMLVFKQFISAAFIIVKKMASLVLAFTPYGILALMALLMLDQGMLLISGMLNFIAAMYVAMILVMTMHTLIIFLAGQNPWQYYKKAYIPLLVAFTTRSSFGTLPVTEETLRNQFNVSQTAATFVPSIGATIGMNACAGIFPAMLVVMTLTILQQPLTGQMILMVMFINAVASLGISGIPGTAYIAATITLTSLNLPYAIVALVQGIDPLIDMGRTATNVNGVMTTALVVDRKQALQ
jgi:L-cystine uptake protein TcyP (sodium:dicarboxylate symporter family)